MAVDRKKYDLVIKVCDFNKRALVEKKFIDKDSVVKLINTDKFKEDLKLGRKLGLLTHNDRYKEREFSKDIPYCDNILLSSTLCSVTKDMQIEGDSIVAGIDLLDTEDGRKIRSMIEKGIPMGVSMACRMPTSLANDRDKFYLSEILGVDFTLSPDLDTELLAVNFSATDATDSDGDVLHVYSTKNLTNDRILSKNFSLVENIRETISAPHLILRNRINEVLRLCKSKKQDYIDKNAVIIREYIQGYVLNWIMNQLKAKNDINVAMSLRLSNYLKDTKPCRDLQRSFRKLRTQLDSTGVMDRVLQKELNKNYRTVMLGLFDYINIQLAESGKKLEV